MQYMMQQTGYTMFPMPLGQSMRYQGLWRDWLAACFAGSFALFFGSLWLYNQLVLLAFVLLMVILPSWSAGIIYITYNQPNGNVFTTWWYACITVF